MSGDVHIRRLGAGDAEAMQAFVRGLSWRARVDRFFSPVRELNPKQLERVLSGRGLSLAAVDARGSIVGHGEYAIGDHGCAEFGIVVADAWQGRGLGERLVEALMEHARNAGISVFGGVALADNRPMRRFARKLGFVFKRDDDPQLVRLERFLGSREQLAA